MALERTKKPRELNLLALAIIEEATVEADEERPAPDDGKDPAAVALGRNGGLKGGKARAEKLTAEERRRIAKKAASARWATHPK